MPHMTKYYMPVTLITIKVLLFIKLIVIIVELTEIVYTKCPDTFLIRIY
jgi:hypothetical protein